MQAPTLEITDVDAPLFADITNLIVGGNEGVKIQLRSENNGLYGFISNI